MPSRKTPKKTTKRRKRRISSYNHRKKSRANNPPAGLVNSESDPDDGEKQTYEFDPHLDPQLQWAGKTERTSFEVPTVSLHVHENIDPRTIIEAVRKRNGNGASAQASLFEEEREIPFREAIEFYQHSHDWSNRLIAGDSLLVMNSLLQKENMAGKVQCVYMDPPYGIKYGSNFQPFVNKRDVKDGKDEDLTAEPEMIRAFRDTWELGIHSYLSYLRDRLLLARELLTDSGSVFVQISDENLHHVRELMDEVFGAENFFSLVTFKKTLPLGSKGLAGISDYLIWYCKDIKQIKYHELFEEKSTGQNTGYRWLELPDGQRRKMTYDERNNLQGLPQNARPFFTSALSSSGYTPTCMYDFKLGNKIYKCGKKSWRTNKEGMQNLIEANRIFAPGALPCYVQYHEDFPVQPIHNLWNDTHGASDMSYVVQTSLKPIQRCILMTTDPGDLVFDPTCGSGTTAFVAEQWGRRWITCDTSRVATTLTKQRLMTATFDYYKLAHENEGIGSGFEYKNVPHITLKSIANDEPPATETLYDQPIKDTKKARVTGPFTVEAVPAPTVKPVVKATPPPQGNLRSRRFRRAYWRNTATRRVA